MASYQELTSLDALEELIEASHEQPVLFFKHSTTCPISVRAFGEFEKYLQTTASQPVRHALIVVQNARPVSNKLAEITGIRHESPQAILMRDGDPVWNDSHFELRSDKLAEAVHQ